MGRTLGLAVGRHGCFQVPGASSSAASSRRRRAAAGQRSARVENSASTASEVTGVLATKRWIVLPPQGRWVGLVLLAQFARRASLAGVPSERPQGVIARHAGGFRPFLRMRFIVVPVPAVRPCVWHAMLLPLLALPVPQHGHTSGRAGEGRALRRGPASSRRPRRGVGRARCVCSSSLDRSVAHGAAAAFPPAPPGQPPASDVSPGCCPAPGRSGVGCTGPLAIGRRVPCRRARITAPTTKRVWGRRML